jgi:hypothetical protein
LFTRIHDSVEQTQIRLTLDALRHAAQRDAETLDRTLDVKRHASMIPAKTIEVSQGRRGLNAERQS